MYKVFCFIYLQTPMSAPPQIEIISFSVKDAPGSKTVPKGKLGFMMRTAQTRSSAKSHLQLDVEEGKCPFDLAAGNNKTAGQHNMIFFTEQPQVWNKGIAFQHSFADQEAGLYDLEFFNCRGESFVNFEVKGMYLA